jgi:hypothetical protein
VDNLEILRHWKWASPMKLITNAAGIKALLWEMV